MSSSALAEPAYWQVMLTYDSEGVRVVEAAEIPPMRKKIRTPGLAGAPGTIECRAEWVDAEGKTLAATLTELPIGKRNIPTLDPPSGGPVLPEEGVLVIRLEGPEHGKSAPAALRLAPIGAKGLGDIALRTQKAFRQMGTKSHPIGTVKRSAPLAEKDGPVSATKIRDTGPDGNRFVMGILGDGYTAANLANGDFTGDVANISGALGGNNSWNVFYGGTNLYQINVESNQMGADEDRDEGQPSVFVDTYLNSTFWSFGIERLLTLDMTGEMRAISAANSLIGVGVWDQLAVLVNSTRYGGAGGPVVVASLDPFSSDILIHELGHSFAGLADEYTDPFPAYPPGDPEPNVDFDFSGPGLKWLVWVEAGTPLPTPEEFTYADVVGAFEGARYLTTGIYRPTLDCAMRSLFNPVFCPICNEAHLLKYFDLVSLADAAFPDLSEPHKVGPEGIVFSIDPLPIMGLEFEWFLDGVPLPDASGPEAKLFSSDVTETPQELMLVVSFPTPFIRQEMIEASFTWTVQSTGEEPISTATRTPSPTSTPEAATPSPTPTPEAATPSPTHTPETANPSETPDYDFNDDTFIDGIDTLTLIPMIRAGVFDNTALFDFSLQWEKVEE
jgi:hypothetical protein